MLNGSMVRRLSVGTALLGACGAAALTTAGCGSTGTTSIKETVTVQGNPQLDYHLHREGKILLRLKNTSAQTLHVEAKIVTADKAPYPIPSWRLDTGEYNSPIGVFDLGALPPGKTETIPIATKTWWHGQVDLTAWTDSGKMETGTAEFGG